MDTKPPRTLLPELEQLLLKRPPLVADAIRRVVTDIRPCVTLRSTRVGDGPLQGRFVDRILGRPRPKPVLPLTTSKFGGTPYVEVLSDLDGSRFIGQINFEEVGRSLAKLGARVPAGLPTRGLLAVDLVPGAFRAKVRWYRDPNENQAVQPTNPATVPKYEAKIDFGGGWSLRGLEWFDGVPDSDDELWEYMNDLEIPGVDVDGDGGHKLFGHANDALNDHYGFEPPPGRSKSIRDYVLLWRIDYDNAAGFSWGTNRLYVILHADDLRASAFQHAIVVGANA